MGRDILSCEFGGNLSVLGIDPAATDINSTDVIGVFDPGFDFIGLASGLTVNDIVLEPIQDVTITYSFEGPQALLQVLSPGRVPEYREPASGTLIRVRNSNAILAFVEEVTPNELQSSIVSVQGF